nr:MAG TPA: hypothetical protein [Caudoviricetes sp.]
MAVFLCCFFQSIVIYRFTVLTNRQRWRFLLLAQQFP